MKHPFEDLPEGLLESLNNLQGQYDRDTSPQKVDLMTGVYKTDRGEAFVLPSVIKAKQKVFNDPAWNHEYPASHLGTQCFRDESAKLFFGPNSDLLKPNRIASMQALGASGACHMGTLFLKLHYGPWNTGAACRKVYIPAESWTNHVNVFTFLGVEAASLPYYDSLTGTLAFSALNDAITALPPQSVVVLQTCAQNPTGCDPNLAQWRELAATFVSGGHFAFFDAAYSGFVSGSAYTDAECVRIFAAAGVPLLLAATYGKAFGLYGERVGILSITAPTAEIATRMEQQMQLLARAETGAMPIFGAMVVETILKDPQLHETWKEDVRSIATQMRERRSILRNLLEHELQTPGDWKRITEQVGMFS
ncbi:aspartate aminotransferase [Athelia psychrophila]|uniref:Aspartate aminotransferase n=1 Tax=Athelia psychrophila TaxID=1759441 RepID=A0A166W7D7_9AGAM|nr:aspartate aminotransferase [Fibularhizoctonia sp. CBS 109695]